MSINPPTVDQLGVIVTNAVVRKVIYGSYVVAIILAGAVQVYFMGVHLDAPSWFGGVNAVLLYLGAPVGTLAAANTGAVKRAVAPPASPTA